jgi:hypothetical protein
LVLGGQLVDDLCVGGYQLLQARAVVGEALYRARLDGRPEQHGGVRSRLGLGGEALEVFSQVRVLLSNDSILDPASMASCTTESRPVELVGLPSSSRSAAARIAARSGAASLAGQELVALVVTRGVLSRGR